MHGVPKVAVVRGSSSSSSSSGIMSMGKSMSMSMQYEYEYANAAKRMCVMGSKHVDVISRRFRQWFRP